VRVVTQEQFPDPVVPLLSYELEGVEGFETMLAATLTLLSFFVPCDNLVWNRVDFAADDVLVRASQPDERYREPAVARQLLDLPDHPVVSHYLGGGDPGEPVVLSQLVSGRGLRSTRAYAELFHPLGVADQLCVLGSAQLPLRATGWAWNRGSGGFTERERLRVRAARVALWGLEARLDPAVPAGARPAALEAHGLTRREVDVLVLLARGLTATAIAHQLRIAEPTVRKHLEHAYAKLGVHDRVLAVQRVRALGLA
jgi:DNA-binding CsgD family transcriptional regulator